MDSLHHIIYQSTAVAALTGPELGRLLRQSRAHNYQAGVTGMLLYDGACFLQVLEGPGPAVICTFGRIRLDCRHTDVQVLANGPVTRRQFSNWSMGLLNQAGGLETGFDDPQQPLLGVTDAGLWMLLYDFQLNAGRTRRYRAC